MAVRTSLGVLITYTLVLIASQHKSECQLQDDRSDTMRRVIVEQQHISANSRSIVPNGQMQPSGAVQPGSRTTKKPTTEDKVIPSFARPGFDDSPSSSVTAAKTNKKRIAVASPATKMVLSRSKRRIIDNRSQCIQAYCSQSGSTLDRITCILRFCNRSVRGAV